MAHNLTPSQALDLFGTPARKPLPADSEAFLDAAGHITIMHGVRGLAGYVWGQEGAPTVLLVHGWESHSGNMRGFVAPLVAQGLRVVAMDAPAHGASPGNRLDLLDYGDAIYAALRELGDVYGIIAHSFGAPSAVNMLERYPDNGIERLVLIGSPCRLSDVFQRFTAALGIGTGAYRDMLALMEARTGYPVDWFSVDAMTPAPERAVLLVHDRDDDIVPFSDGERIARAWHGAHFLVTHGLGHRKILRDTTVIGQVAAFMAVPEAVRRIS